METSCSSRISWFEGVSRKKALFFPWLVLCFLKDAADFFAEEISPFFFFGAKTFWYPKKFAKIQRQTRRCTGIWDDMPGMIVELREFHSDIFPDTEDEEEAGSWGRSLGRGTKMGRGKNFVRSRSSLMDFTQEVTR